MRIFWPILILVFGMAGCDRPSDQKGNSISETGKLVFETGEIVFSEKTLAGVCFGDAGEGQLAARVSLTPEGANDFYRLTSENVGGPLTLIFKEKTYFTATIMEPIEAKNPIAMVLVSPEEEKFNEIEALFGVPEIKKCQD
jgi:preprotein translocase subunit SecD